jgi:hypothetical protein
MRRACPLAIHDPVVISVAGSNRRIHVKDSKPKIAPAARRPGVGLPQKAEFTIKSGRELMTVANQELRIANLFDRENLFRHGEHGDTESAEKNERFGAFRRAWVSPVGFVGWTKSAGPFLRREAPQIRKDE